MHERVGGTSIQDCAVTAGAGRVLSAERRSTKIGAVADRVGTWDGQCRLAAVRRGAAVSTADATDLVRRGS